MENATKALLIASGTLMGVMLIALMMYFFRSLSPFEETRQKTEETDQITAFNEEYTAYEKKLMYGVDLISVLNKAKSNNEKYVAGTHVTGFTYGNEYLVNIEFTLKAPLEDRITVNYLQRKSVFDGTERTEVIDNNEHAYANGKGVQDVKLINNSNPKTFNEPTTGYLGNVNKNIETTTKLVTGSYESEFKAGTYKLLAQDGEPQTSANVASLLNVADAISQSIKNTSKNVEKKLWYKEGFVEHFGWSSAEWRTALYDLKSKKFKCTDIKYNTDTGRIEYMKFEQI